MGDRERRYFTAESMRLIDIDEGGEVRHELLAQIAGEVGMSVTKVTP